MVSITLHDGPGNPGFLGAVPMYSPIHQKEEEEADESVEAKMVGCCNRPCTKERTYWWLNAIGISVIVLYFLGVIFMNIWVTRSNRRVVGLYGDSLVRVACDHFLNDFLYSDLFYTKPQYETEIIHYGKSDFHIVDLKAAMHREMFHRFDYTTMFTWRYAGPPDTVIMMWDSDVLPGPWDGSEPMDQKNVDAYTENLHDTIVEFKKHCKVFILAGPSLNGELPRGQNPKDADLDYFVGLNNRTAALHNITYINTRDMFFANLPEGWDKTKGYLTIDGEHSNDRGTKLLRTAFRKALLASDDMW